MLGCKYRNKIVKISGIFELIDTCWDVNQLTGNQNMQALKELIDTCWDVNITEVTTPVNAVTELIDTCWDVNMSIVQRMYSKAVN